MNLKCIIEKQMMLDEALTKAHSLEGDYSDKMLIALYTEVAEFANEVQSFKYWKKSKKIDEKNLLEEYADGIHFLLSFAIKAKCSLEIDPLILSEDINQQFLLAFKSISEMTNDISKEKVEKSFAIYLGLAKLLKISDDQIIEAYLSKNKKNFERIKNNY